MASLGFDTGVLGNYRLLDVDNSEDAKRVKGCIPNITNLQCACGTTVDITKHEVIQKFDNIIAGSDKKLDMLNAFQDITGDDERLTRVDIHNDCPNCANKLCFGCGALITPKAVRNTVQADGLEIAWHCDHESLAILWMLLYGFDEKKQLSTLPSSSTRKGAHKAEIKGLHKEVDYGSSLNDPLLPPPSEPGLQLPLSNTFYGTGKTLAVLQGDGHSDRDFAFPSKPCQRKAGTGCEAEDELDDDDENHTFEDEDEDFTFEDEDHEHRYDVQYNVRDAGDVDSFSLQPLIHQNRDECVVAKMTEKNSDDLLTTQVVGVLNVLLPNIEPLLNHIADILQDDDLQMKRAGVYESVLAAVTLLAQGASTSDLIVNGRRILGQPGHNLLKLSFNEATVKQNAPVVQAQSLLVCMKNLHAQCQFMIDAIQKVNKHGVLDDDDDDVVEKMLYICRSVCDLVDCIKSKQLAQHEVSQLNDGETAATKAERKELDIDAWHKDLAVMELPGDAILSTSHYAEQAESNVGFIGSSKGRMLALMRDINILKTSLPPGIFVRHCESRLDIMKVLIIGPKDTPYANGIFEFDLTCPADYPHAPPGMFFRTTGNGIHTINPNLYANGKFGLSLLGTWSGQPWETGKSTLLQLLVSIQAMIFVEEPYYNEPRYNDAEGSEPSLDYNRGLYSIIVKHGMMDWIDPRSVKNWDTGDGKVDNDGANTIWREVVQTHFEAHASEILTTVDELIEDCKEKKRGSLQPSFAGTGWQGKTLEDDDRDEGDWCAGAALVEKLEGAVKQLDKIRP